ncbi:unnamed protein product, partial [Staurois parvus]
AAVQVYHKRPYLLYELYMNMALTKPNYDHDCKQGRTDNSWGPRAIGDHGAPVSLPKLKKV